MERTWTSADDQIAANDSVRMNTIPGLLLMDTIPALLQAKLYEYLIKLVGCIQTK